MSRARKILKNTLWVILVLLTLYLGYAGVITYKYNHVYTTAQKLNYIRYYMSRGFPKTNQELLKSKIFKNNDVSFYQGDFLDADPEAINFKTKHFEVSCYGDCMVNGRYVYDYSDNTLYDYNSYDKVKDKKVV